MYTSTVAHVASASASLADPRARCADAWPTLHNPQTSSLPPRNANCAPAALRMPARSPRRSTNDLLNQPGFVGAAARFWQVRSLHSSYREDQEGREKVID